VSTKDAGVIIGKAGKNVADLREQTGVKAGVSKVIPGVHDRVLTVTGNVEAVAKVSSADILSSSRRLILFSRPTTSLSSSSSTRTQTTPQSQHPMSTPLFASLSHTI
jgi:heterogeneous nuclear rnp K-like protein 2